MSHICTDFTAMGQTNQTTYRLDSRPERLILFHIIAEGRCWIRTSDHGDELELRGGDVVVLPITAFSPGVGQMGAGEDDDPMAMVKHNFEGKAFASSLVSFGV